MPSAVAIGNLSLNIAFVLYLVIYLPQIKHNQKPEHLAELSLGWHFTITISFALDLAYSLLKPLPWQYQTVSVVALGLLSIQHLQLTLLAKKQKSPKLKLFHATTILFLLGLVVFSTFFHAFKLPTWTLAIGTVSRIGFLINMLPQIYQNMKLQSAEALSTTFLNLSILLTTLDMISAWCLDWGLPNQIGSPITLMLTLTLRWQKAYYSRGRGFTVNLPYVSDVEVVSNNTTPKP